MLQVLAKSDNKRMEEISKKALNIAMINNWEFTYINWLIKDEIQQTKMNGTLFRKNGINSHTLTFFAKNFGSDYLYNLLNPLLVSFSKKNFANFEVYYLLFIHFIFKFYDLLFLIIYFILFYYYKFFIFYFYFLFLFIFYFYFIFIFIFIYSFLF